MENNYFVCTLGQAALPGVQRPFSNVNHLIDRQASVCPDLPAVGFYVASPDSPKFEARILTFDEVQLGVAVVAEAISTKAILAKNQTVGLLCGSSPAFLFTWLGLIRLGHPVLLIAPQCSASSISKLSHACDSPILFHDEAHEKLAQDAVVYSADANLTTMSAQTLPFEDDEDVFKMILSSTKIATTSADVAGTDVAYLHHTSGTSTGVPKPIPQTHRGGVGVLPALDGSHAATFTTTPLYHGGVADLFRAWTSSAMIWLFPSQSVPITAANVVKCLDAASGAVAVKCTPSVKYFSSVPYVLQMMAQDKTGLEHLRRMDIVGVGGAALPPSVGDELVRQGVNLVSRYGSAECGFLMSSHRDYDQDKEWQFLRQPEKVKQLTFEKGEEGQSELVIQSGWPHMAKTNRDNGSFATSDLFAPHPSIPNAWKYHSRSDSQLTLITGKKFDPAPLEGAIAASSPVLSEVLIFGNGKPYPGALVFRSEAAQGESDEVLIRQIAPVVEKLNIESQSHARVPRNMLVPMPFEPGPLEKSSKGTVLRGKAEEKFQDTIEAAYNKTTLADPDVSDADLPTAIARIVGSVVGGAGSGDEKLTSNTDLFSFGVDSVACVQIRHALSQLLPKNTKPLPLTIVEDSGTISKLSDTITRYRKGEQTQEEADNICLIKELVDEYGSFNRVAESESEPTEKPSGHTILLTGPTGLLGAHVLSQLLANQKVTKIFLLVRGATAHAAMERVTKSLESRRLPTPSNFDTKAHVLPCKLANAQLGLCKSDYETLTNEVDTIFHLAWSVNFIISLRSLGTTHLAGLQNLLNLALATKRHARFVFCSSVASVSNLPPTRRIPESIVDDVTACGPTGYAQSKLAAELICARCASSARMQDRITVVRVGQLSGDTKWGVWNMTEAYPLMFASSNATGVLPDLGDEVLGWLPVDIAARGYIEAALAPDSKAMPDDGKKTGAAVKVLHLINTSKATRFRDLARCLERSGDSAEVVSVTEWLDKLAALQDADETKNHPALKLLSFWRGVYGSRPDFKSSEGDKDDVVKGMLGGQGKNQEEEDDEQYDMTLSRGKMPSLDAAIGPLSGDYLLKLWNWVKENSE